MIFRPAFANILIKPQDSQKETSNGILLPDSAQDKVQQGEIVAIGAGELDKDGKLIPVRFTTGQVVAYKSWGVTELKINGEKHVVVNEKDILGSYEG